MIIRNRTLVFMVGFCCVSLPIARGQVTSFTYQGQIEKNSALANGRFDFKFEHYDRDSGSSPISSSIERLGVDVKQGLLSGVELDFGPGVFDGRPLWSQLSLRSSGDGSYESSSPRYKINAAPYAIAASKLIGTPSFDPGPSQPAFSVGNNVKITNLNCDFLDGLDSTAFWRLGGNGNTRSGVDFLGTSDARPLEVRVDNKRALLLEPAPSAANILFGFGNTIGLGVHGVTIANLSSRGPRRLNVSCELGGCYRLQAAHRRRSLCSNQMIIEKLFVSY